MLGGTAIEVILYKGPSLEPGIWQGLNNFLTLSYPCPSPLSLPKLKPPCESKARITQIFSENLEKVLHLFEWYESHVLIIHFLFNIYVSVELGNWQVESFFSHLQLCKHSIFCGWGIISWCYSKSCYTENIWWPQPAKYNSDEYILASPSLSVHTVRTLNPSTYHSTVSF